MLPALHRPCEIGWRASPYNVGLDAANLSKEELAIQIRKHVRDLTILTCRAGQRPRQAELHRLEPASAAGRIRGGAIADEGIQELIKGYQMLGRGRFMNV